MTRPDDDRARPVFLRVGRRLRLIAAAVAAGCKICTGTLEAESGTELDPVIVDHVTALLSLPSGAPVGPAELARVKELKLCCGNLRELRLPFGMTNLQRLFLQLNVLSQLELPPDLASLEVLDLTGNQIGNLSIPPAAQRLKFCYLNRNVLTNLALPGGLSRLEQLGVSQNRLRSFTVPAGYVRLGLLLLDNNRLQRIDFGEGLTNLVRLNLTGNLELRDVAFLEGLSGLRDLELSVTNTLDVRIPPGLMNLESLWLMFSSIPRLTLPPGLVRLQRLNLEFSRVAQLVLPEDSGGILAPGAEELRAAGVGIYFYPPVARMEVDGDRWRGLMRLWIAGPPGRYWIWQSGDLESWHRAGVVTNETGRSLFEDPEARSTLCRFYRAISDP